MRGYDPRRTELRSSGAVGLIEVEVRDGVRIGGIEGGCLVEIEARIGVMRRSRSARILRLITRL